LHEKASLVSENNPIRVFATHCFDENDDYLRVFEFLESIDGFYYLNVSRPENMPTTGGVQEVKNELIAQIKLAEAVIVLTLAYEKSPDLVNFMVDVAEANKIGLIGIRPFGATMETPAQLARRCNEIVEWNNREIVDAIKRQARGEDTSRWEVIDFPGFDENGPISE
jgi:hypothetical protein